MKVEWKWDREQKTKILTEREQKWITNYCVRDRRRDIHTEKEGGIEESGKGQENIQTERERERTEIDNIVLYRMKKYK